MKEENDRDKEGKLLCGTKEVIDEPKNYTFHSTMLKLINDKKS